MIIVLWNACPDGCLLTCDRPALGGGTNCVICNTRPIQLYTCSSNGTPWAMPISRSDTETTTSTVFRVEKVDGCCCTFRVLQILIVLHYILMCQLILCSLWIVIVYVV